MISGGDEAAVCRWRRASLPRKSLLRAINGKCQNCSPRHLRTMGKQPSSLDDVWGSHHRGGNHGKQHVSKSGGQNYLVSSRCFISISLVGGHVCYEMRRILITPIGAACEDVRHPVTCGRLSEFVLFFFFCGLSGNDSRDPTFHRSLCTLGKMYWQTISPPLSNREWQ